MVAVNSGIEVVAVVGVTVRSVTAAPSMLVVEAPMANLAQATSSQEIEVLVNSGTGMEDAAMVGKPSIVELESVDELI